MAYGPGTYEKPGRPLKRTKSKIRKQISKRKLLSNKKKKT